MTLLRMMTLPSPLWKYWPFQSSGKEQREPLAPSPNTPHDIVEPTQSYAQNPLHTFLRNFPVDGEAAKSATSWQQVIVMEFGKRHDTRHTTDFCPRQLVTDLLWICRLCCRLVVDLLLGKWCNGFWPLVSRQNVVLYSSLRNFGCIGNTGKCEKRKMARNELRLRPNFDNFVTNFSHNCCFFYFYRILLF